MGRSGKNGAIPDGWRMVRMGDVAKVETGGTPSRSKPSYWGGSVPWMASGEINQRRVMWTAEHVTQAGLDSSNAKKFPKGTVMLAMNGQGATRGKVALLGIEAACNQSLAAITGNCTDNPFLFQLLRSSYDHLRALTGYGRSGLNLGLIRSFPILLPPLSEQEAIAAVLDSIDEAIEDTEAVIAATEQLRDSLLHELLTRGVPGWHTEWREVPGVGTIPADWKVVRLGDVLKTTTYGTNVSLDRGGRVPILRMNNLQDGEIDLREVRSADLPNEDLGKLSLAPGDILFNRTNSLDLVGKVAIVRDLPQPMSFASYLVRLRVCRSRANPFWLSSLLGFPSCQSRIRKFATPGVSQANINPTSLKSLLIPLPPLLEQRAMATVLDGIDTATEKGHGELERLLSLKGAVSDALLTGRIRVRSHL